MLRDSCRRWYIEDKLKLAAHSDRNIPTMTFSRPFHFPHIRFTYSNCVWYFLIRSYVQDHREQRWKDVWLIKAVSRIWKWNYTSAEYKSAVMLEGRSIFMCTCRNIAEKHDRIELSVSFPLWYEQVNRSEMSPLTKSVIPPRPAPNSIFVRLFWFLQ